jgi:hypothetical protein
MLNLLEGFPGFPSTDGNKFGMTIYLQAVVLNFNLIASRTGVPGDRILHIF